MRILLMAALSALIVGLLMASMARRSAGPHARLLESLGWIVIVAAGSLALTFALILGWAWAL